MDVHRWEQLYAGIYTVHPLMFAFSSTLRDLIPMLEGPNNHFGYSIRDTIPPDFGTATFWDSHAWQIDSQPSGRIYVLILMLQVVWKTGGRC